MLESIRAYFFEKEKNKRLKNGIPSRVTFHPAKKNHYGLLIDASNVDDRNAVTVFAEELRREGNRVKILGYVDGRMESLALSFDVFTSAELTKFSKIPKSPLAESFMDQAFDILINLSIRQNHKALEYICTVSKASLRVGPFYDHQEQNPYDLCIDAEGTSSIKEWIRNLVHTLQKIN